jgi:hypothetical protein
MYLENNNNFQMEKSTRIVWSKAFITFLKLVTNCGLWMAVLCNTYLCATRNNNLKNKHD